MVQALDNLEPQQTPREPAGLNSAWSRWAQTLRSPLGATTAGLLALVLVLAVVAPMLWTTQANADRHRRRSCRARRASTGWAPTTSAGTSSSGCWWRPGLSVVLALLATVLGVVAGSLLGRRAVAARRRRAGRMVDRRGQHRGGVPGPAAGVVLRGDLRGRRDGCGAGDRVRDRARLRPADPDASPAVAGRDYVAAARIAGVGRVRMLAPAHPAQHRRAADRERDRRAPAARCWPSPACLSSAWACSHRLRLGAAARRGAGQHLRQPGCCAGARRRDRARRAGVQPVRRGDRRSRHRRSATATACGAPPPSRRPRAGRPAGRRLGAGDAVLAVEDLRVSFPGRLDRPPVRGVSFTHAARARRSAWSASPGRARA